MIHPYVVTYRDSLNKLHPNLAENLHVLPTLEQPISSMALQFLLSLACQASSAANITLGRDGLKSVPQAWLLANIEREAQLLLDMDDEWEYRRLAEVYFELDIDLAKKLAQLGLNSRNDEVVEAAMDLLDWIIEGGEKNE